MFSSDHERERAVILYVFANKMFQYTYLELKDVHIMKDI